MLPEKRIGVASLAHRQRARAAAPTTWLAVVWFFLIVLSTADARAACTPTATSLCLQGGRFQVEVDWRDYVDNGGPARAVPGGTADSGLFYFYGPDNWEVLVKVLNACQQNDRFWVFAAAATTLQYTITVTDTLTGAVRAYSNPLGQPSPAVTDTEAFATCSGSDGQAEGTWTPCYDSGSNEHPERPYCQLGRMSLGPRSNHGVAALHGEIFVVGGLRLSFKLTPPASILDTVEAYSPDADRWRNDIAPLPLPMHHVNVAAWGGRLFVVGFLTDFDNSASGQVFAYDPVRDVWEERSPMPPGTERGGSGVAVVGDRIFVAGGRRGGPLGVHTFAVADFAAYDPASDTWEKLPDLLGARDDPAAVAVGSTFLTIGGAWLGPVDAYDPGERRWTNRTTIPLANMSIYGYQARSHGAVAAALGSRIFVIGGDAPTPAVFGAFGSNSEYDPLRDVWKEQAMLDYPRRETAAVALGSKIYVVGGEVADVVDTIAAFKPPSECPFTHAPWRCVKRAAFGSAAWGNRSMRHARAVDR